MLLSKCKSAKVSADRRNPKNPKQPPSKRPKVQKDKVFAYCFDTNFQQAFIKEITTRKQTPRNKRYYVPRRQNNEIVAVNGNFRERFILFLLVNSSVWSITLPLTFTDELKFYL